MKREISRGFSVVVLAAGQGTRMGALTREIPKCLLTVQGRTVLDRQLSVFARAGARSVEVVGGHGFSHFREYPNVSYSMNERYETTNMVCTLFSSNTLKQEFQEIDVVISYGDIVFSDEVFSGLLQSSAELGVVIDTEWLNLWEQRFADPLTDAETLRYDERGMITELGNRPSKIEEIMGQYIGLIKFRFDLVEKVRDVWNKLQQERFHKLGHPDQMFMTAFIQILIDLGIETKMVPVRGGWMEFDSPSDIELFESSTRGSSPDIYPNA